MPTIEQEVPTGLFSALRLNPKELGREMLLAACVQWYCQGLLSQSKASEVTGLSRLEFLQELSRRRVSVLDITPEELAAETALLRAAGSR